MLEKNEGRIPAEYGYFRNFLNKHKITPEKPVDTVEHFKWGQFSMPKLLAKNKSIDIGE